MSLEVEYELKTDASVNPQEMENQYGELVNAVLAGLKHYAETGRPI